MLLSHNEGDSLGVILVIVHKPVLDSRLGFLAPSNKFLKWDTLPGGEAGFKVNASARPDGVDVDS